MKKVLFFLVVSLISLSSFSQYSEDMRDYYLAKSQRQKTAGYITLAGGTAALIPGLIMLNNNDGAGWEADWVKGFKASGLILLGTGLLTSSLVLFIASSRNERKANRITLNLNKPVPVYNLSGPSVLPYSVGVSIPIN